MLEAWKESFEARTRMFLDSKEIAAREEELQEKARLGRFPIDLQAYQNQSDFACDSKINHDARHKSSRNRANVDEGDRHRDTIIFFYYPSIALAFIYFNCCEARLKG